MARTNNALEPELIATLDEVALSLRLSVTVNVPVQALDGVVAVPLHPPADGVPVIEIVDDPEHAEFHVPVHPEPDGAVPE